MAAISRRNMMTGAFALSTTALTHRALAGPGDAEFQQGLKAITGGNQLTEQDEIRLGETSYPELIQKFGGLYRNSRAQAALVRFATPLLRTTRRPFKWDIRLLASNEVLGAALPGGKIVLTRGLLTYLADPWELAAVISHEMGHAELSHHRDELGTRQALGGLVSIGAGVAAAFTGYQIVADIIQTVKGPVLDIAVQGYAGCAASSRGGKSRRIRITGCRSR